MTLENRGALRVGIPVVGFAVAFLILEIGEGGKRLRYALAGLVLGLGFAVPLALPPPPMHASTPVFDRASDS